LEACVKTTVSRDVDAAYIVRLVASILLCVLVGSSCTGGSRPTASTSSSPGASAGAIQVTRDDRSFPARCRPASVAATLIDFFDAFDGDDGQRLDSLIAPEPAFQWYSALKPGGGRSPPTTAVQR